MACCKEPKSADCTQVYSTFVSLSGPPVVGDVFKTKLFQFPGFLKRESWWVMLCSGGKVHSEEFIHRNHSEVTDKSNKPALFPNDKSNIKCFESSALQGTFVGLSWHLWSIYYYLSKTSILKQAMLPFIAVHSKITYCSEILFCLARQKFKCRPLQSNRNKM